MQTVYIKNLPSWDHPLAIEVTYEGFSDVDGWVIDGTESVETDDRGFLGTSAYTADLVLSGDHEGYLTADAVINAGGLDGTIESEVDGNRLVLPRGGA